MPGPKPRLNLPYDRWPLADRVLWQKSFSNDDPFGETANAALAQATLVHWFWAWRRFLGFLANYDPAALDIAPTERLTITRIRLFVAHLAETNAVQSIASTIDALYRATCITMPEQDWSWLRAIKVQIHKSTPARAQSGPIITSIQLLELGQKLMDDSKPASGTPISMHDAINYRDGLMAAFLAFIPLRPRNLAALEIDRHLVREGDRWFVMISSEETKTKQPIEFSVPELLVPYLSYYLDAVRPRILRSITCTALWVSPKSGSTLSRVGISKSFQAALEASRDPHQSSRRS